MIIADLKSMVIAKLISGCQPSFSLGWSGIETKVFRKKNFFDRISRIKNWIKKEYFCPGRKPGQKVIIS